MILIPIKQVPDSWSEKELNPVSKLLAREKADPVLNDLDEFAIEAALQLAEVSGMPTMAITMGPEGAREALLKALSMGVDEAIHICDPELSGACYMQTSAVIAAVAKKVNATLIFAGLESTDGKGGVVPALTAAHLGWPNVSSVSNITFEGGRISASLQETLREVKFNLPNNCVVSLAENSYEPRFPSFKGIMAAKKKTITELNLSDLNGHGFDLDLRKRTVEIIDWEQTPPRSKGELISDPSLGSEALTHALNQLQEA